MMAEPVRLKHKDLLSMADLEGAEISFILEGARICKQKQKANEMFVPLLGKTLGMIFHKPSARTRISFDTGMYQLGGHAILLTDGEIGLGVRETVQDIGRMLSRYVDGVMIRTFDQAMVEELAKSASIPVINGLTDFEHPCQVLADLLTLRERFGKLEGLKVAFVGDGNNVANSWAYAAALAGLHLTVSSPKDYQLSQPVLDEARRLALGGKGRVDLVADPAEAVKGADMVYTDVWASMGQEDEKETRLAAFSRYQVNAALMSHAKKEAVVMHCLPAHRGEEISAEIMEKHQQTIFGQAENRLHVQKALMVLLMGEKNG
jgi:ornithine carbamoyltransferase